MISIFVSNGFCLLYFERFKSFCCWSARLVLDNVALTSRAMTRPCQSLNLAATMVRTLAFDIARTSP